MAGRSRPSNSPMTRPGRLLSSTTRSPSRTASRTSCVTNTMLSLRRRQMPSSTSCSRSRVIASSAPNGSSISSTSASWASARARATRCRMPPDSSCGRLSANAVSWTRSSSSATRSRRCARGTPAARSGSSTLRAAVSHGNSADSWNISETRRPPVEISPDVGASSPATRFSSVLLPQPDAPIRRDELSRRHREGHPIEGLQRGVTTAEDLGYVADLYRGARGGHRGDRRGRRPSCVNAHGLTCACPSALSRALSGPRS